MKKKNIPLFLLRLALFLLILANAALIFHFSAQDGEKSSQQSDRLESAVIDVILPDHDPEKPIEEQTWLESNLELLLRKAGHVTVFGTLSSLIFLFLLTWKRNTLSHYLASLLLTLLYAISDEIHQLFVDGRSCHATDVLIDMAGALLFTSVILLIVLRLRKKEPKLTATEYALTASALSSPLLIAVASDLHGKGFGETADLLRASSPDLILIPGDLMDDKELSAPDHGGYAFLEECARIAPTYYSLGNHEIACYHKGNPWRHPTPIPLTEEMRSRIEKTGAHLLDNDCTHVGELCICGLTSGINKKENKPNEEVLEKFATEEGYRILLCHHPEYYTPHIRKTPIELTVCGHAHGGQWRIFSQGIYAPGQGLLPKYTAGILDGRCVISRGIGNHTFIPRIYNEPELILIHLTPKK